MTCNTSFKKVAFSGIRHTWLETLFLLQDLSRDVSVSVHSHHVGILIAVG